MCICEIFHYQLLQKERGVQIYMYIYKKSNGYSLGSCYASDTAFVNTFVWEDWKKLFLFLHAVAYLIFHVCWALFSIDLSYNELLNSELQV